MTDSEYDQYLTEVEEHGNYHSTDCENAHTARCRCWCGGQYHGIKTGFLARIDGELKHRSVDPDDTLMHPDMGGEVAVELDKLSGVQFRCIGICGKTIAALPLYGYKHDNGYADKNGEKWWLFVHCPYCGYDTAIWKLPKRLEVSH